jgi:hypothetical protein
MANARGARVAGRIAAIVSRDGSSRWLLAPGSHCATLPPAPRKSAVARAAPVFQQNVKLSFLLDFVLPGAVFTSSVCGAI